MGILRTVKHILSPTWLARRRFTPQVFTDIERAIEAAEARHAGEIRFVVETALDLPELWNGMTSRQRALETFARLGVWDTEGNNGILLYVLLADHAVEIVADRGIAARVSAEDWRECCKPAQAAYAAGQYGPGSVALVAAVAGMLAKHFPSSRGDPDELPNQPILL
jgi:uncharacterized membrane protein